MISQQVPLTVRTRGTIFTDNWTEGGFYDFRDFNPEMVKERTRHHALERLCQQHEPLYMPEFVDARISAPRDSPIWTDAYTTTSIRAIGTTQGGNPVAIYAHTPTIFSDPAGLWTAIQQKVQQYVRTGRFGDLNPAGPFELPVEEFRWLEGMDGFKDESGEQRVWVVDYTRFEPMEIMMTKKRALKHPQTIPYFCSEVRAERFIDTYFKHFSDPSPQGWLVPSQRIAIWSPLGDIKGKAPSASFLYIGSGKRCFIDPDTRDPHYERDARKVHEIVIGCNGDTGLHDEGEGLCWQGAISWRKLQFIGVPKGVMSGSQHVFEKP